MLTSDKFCLKLNDFQENAVTSFGNLREDQDFSDVTLVCKETQVGAHKVILAAASTFFRNLLKMNKNHHPFIYMKGVTAKNLISIVDFIYYGEVSVCQEDIDEFLSVADELQLKGLTGGPVLYDTNTAAVETNYTTKSEMEKSGVDKSVLQNTNDENKTVKEEFEDTIMETTKHYDKVYIDTGMNDLTIIINSMKAKIDGVWTCSVCGKTTGNNGDNLKSHIESHHIEGVIYSCEKCGQNFKLKKSLMMHNNRKHKNI